MKTNNRQIQSFKSVSGQLKAESDKWEAESGTYKVESVLLPSSMHPSLCDIALHYAI